MTPSPNLRDPQQFNDAYRRLAPLALASANRVLRDEAAAEDVVQDVFVQLWLRPDSYDASRGSLASYVSMLARSRALDRWRARSSREHAVARAEEQARADAQPTDRARAERNRAKAPDSTQCLSLTLKLPATTSTFG